MKRLIIGAALASAALASGCATYDTTGTYATYDVYGRPVYGTAMVTPANAVLNPTYPVVDGDNNPVPYRQYSMFFRDRGLHQQVPSALTPQVVVPPSAVPVG
jgi:hypothetical protein